MNDTWPHPDNALDAETMTWLRLQQERAPAGHWDELRGAVTPSADAPASAESADASASISAPWQTFIGPLQAPTTAQRLDLNTRMTNLQRQVIHADQRIGMPKVFSAEIAMRAAMTGHLVLSTLHTNDAPSTLTRLLNMDVAAFNIAAAVNLITAQRLARRLCSCKQPIDVPLDMLLNAGFHESQLDGSPLYRAVGCELCGGSGYKGRLGVYQVMPITEAIESIILAHGTALEIEAQARREGVRTLREAGLLKVKQGFTTLEEIISCTNH